MIQKNNIATKALVLFKMYSIIEIFQKKYHYYLYK